jgi:WD repeat-containing and planar cell polarity effector protein
VKNQLLNEEATPSDLLDLSVYLANPQSLAKLCWSKKPDIAYHQDHSTQNDTFLLLAFDNGPLAFARVCGGAGLKGDIHQSGFTGDVLVHKYLAANQVEKAINILLCLNWDAYGAMCLLSLHRIANFIFKTPHTLDLEMLLQKALGSFHTPVKALCPETEAEFLDQVNDLTRRFFFYLLRNQSFEKAFSLAIDINDVDLFLLLHQEAKVCELFELSNEALVKAREIYNIEDMEGESVVTLYQ